MKRTTVAMMMIKVVCGITNSRQCREEMPEPAAWVVEQVAEEARGVVDLIDRLVQTEPGAAPPATIDFDSQSILSAWD